LAAGQTATAASIFGHLSITSVAQVADETVVLHHRQRPVFLQQIDEPLHVGVVRLRSGLHLHSASASGIGGGRVHQTTTTTASAAAALFDSATTSTTTTSYSALLLLLIALQGRRQQGESILHRNVPVL
jgi:hypothetical protein